MGRRNSSQMIFHTPKRVLSLQYKFNRFLQKYLIFFGHADFYKQPFFLIQPQCWLTFSWIGLKCCSGVAWYIQEYLSSLTSLVDISIIIMRRFLYLLYLCQFLDRGLFILYICGLFFFFFLHFRYD